MKRKLVGALVMVLIGAFALTGGTLAYFTAQGEVTNGLTTGKIDMAIWENFNPEDAKNLAPTNPDHPRKIMKQVRIQNQGGDAFVRVKFVKAWGTEDEKGNFVPDPALATDNIKLFFAEDTNWQQFGEYYYTRLDKAKFGEVSQSDMLLESFAFVAGEDDEPYKAKMAHIDVLAEAIQVSNGALEAEWGMTYDEETGQFAMKGGEVND